MMRAGISNGSSNAPQAADDAAGAREDSASSRPRASSSVCVRPQLFNTSRLRSRSLLRASDTPANGSSSNLTGITSGTATTTTSMSSLQPHSPPSSPRFGASLLPRLAAVFGSGAQPSGGGSSSSNSTAMNEQGSSSSSSLSHASFPANNSIGLSLDRASVSDSDSSTLTFGEDSTSSSTRPPTPSLPVLDASSNNAFPKTGNSSSYKKAKSSGSPITSIPFLPRRRTLSNLLNQITSSSNSKDKEASTVKRDPSSPSYNSLQLMKKEASSPSNLSNKVRDGSDNMHVLAHGWSTSTSAAFPTPPATSSSYSNPFASAFSYGDSPSAIGPRPSSPRLKKKDSYMALNIPSTPGASTPSLAYTENGNRPLRGEDEDYILPSPITEADEQEHPTHPHHRHHYTESSALPNAHSHSTTSPLYTNSAADQVPAPISFLSSLTSTAPTLSTQRASHQTLSKLLPPILFLCVSFVISLTVIFYMVSTIPLNIPHNISEIKLQTVALRDYSRKGLSEGLHVSAVLSALFVFKQAFSVPGSILVNILFGSLYGTYAATLCACIFTGVGSVLAYYMARLCAPLVERFFPRALATTKSALLSGSSSDLFSYLLLARLFPLLPYSALNIACGVLKVPVSPYFITLVLGSFPYNFVTTQLGDLLGNLANSAEAGNINAIWTWDLIFKLAVASLLSAAPVIFKEQLKGFIGGSNEASKSDAPSLSPSPITTDGESFPLDPIPGDSTTPQQPYAYESYSIYEHDTGSAPLLRRDRTDSSASEVLFAPALELSSPTSASSNDSKRHSKSWSFSWKNLRRSLNSESAFSEYSIHSTASSSFASHSTARTSFDEEVGYTDEENARVKNVYYDLQRRSSGSSYQSFASRDTHKYIGTGKDSRPSSIDYSLKQGRRTASIESASSSPTVAQHHQFIVPSPASYTASRSSQEWDQF